MKKKAKSPIVRSGTSDGFRSYYLTLPRLWGSSVNQILAVTSVLPLLERCGAGGLFGPEKRARVAISLGVQAGHQSIRVLEVEFLRLRCLDRLEREIKSNLDKTNRLKSEFRGGVKKVHGTLKRMMKLSGAARASVAEGLRGALDVIGPMPNHPNRRPTMPEVLQALASAFPELVGAHPKRFARDLTYALALAWREVRRESPNVHTIVHTRGLKVSPDDRYSGQFPEFVREWCAAVQTEAPGDWILQDVLSRFPRKTKPGKNVHSDEALDEDWKRICADAEEMIASANRSRQTRTLAESPR